jgi:hypothetical protein
LVTQPWLFGQHACTGLQGTWTSNYSEILTFDQSLQPDGSGNFALSGDVTGDLCGTVLTWSLSGTIDTNGDFSFTATGSGCLATEIYTSGTLSGFNCDTTVNGAWSNNAMPPQGGSYSMARDSGPGDARRPAAAAPGRHNTSTATLPALMYSSDPAKIAYPPPPPATR